MQSGTEDNLLGGLWREVTVGGIASFGAKPHGG